MKANYYASDHFHKVVTCLKSPIIFIRKMSIYIDEPLVELDLESELPVDAECDDVAEDDEVL